MKHSITRRKLPFHSPQGLAGAPLATAGFLWSRTKIPAQMWEFVQAVGEWPDLTISIDSGGLCISLHDVALGHLRWNGRLELPFGLEVRDRLLAEEMAAPDPDRPGSGQLVFDVRTMANVDRAVWLLRLAYLSQDAKLRVCPA